MKPKLKNPKNPITQILLCSSYKKKKYNVLIKEKIIYYFVVNIKMKQI